MGVLHKHTYVYESINLLYSAVFLLGTIKRGIQSSKKTNFYFNNVSLGYIALFYRLSALYYCVKIPTYSVL